MTGYVFDVEGMTCGHCVMQVQRAIEAVNGVMDVSVTLDPGRAIVVAADVEPDRIAQAVRNAGYEAGARD
jgi:copper chaperone